MDKLMADFYNDIIADVAFLSPDLGVSTRIFAGVNMGDDLVVDRFRDAFGDESLPTNVELRLDVGTGPQDAISRRRPCFLWQRNLPKQRSALSLLEPALKS
ncbi:MAG TPA: hypothetical protein VGY56_14950 [Verrucomicrobiae bacterium]|nr:hypothetical protein [Verrucomicrobiae bacterium]